MRGTAVSLMGRVGGPVWAVAALGVALTALSLAVAFESRDALWLDESWTGAIVGQPHWGDVARQIYWDVNAPLYYGLMWAWTGVFGLSDLALRAPSLIAAFATPLAAALWPTPGVGRGTRLAWGAMLAGWFPALCYAQEARCYALLLLVCTLQTIAFTRLMAEPGVRRATIWAALAASAILIHYDALYLGAAQGLVYLGRQPRRALASWPAALAFAPAFGWLAFHAPRIAQFARPEIAWYSALRTGQLPQIAAYALDGGVSGAEMMLWALLALGVSAASWRLLLSRAAKGGRTPAGPSIAPAGWAAFASLCGAALLVAMGFLRPSFTFRYLTPAEPGLTLGLLLLVGALPGRRLAPALQGAVALALTLASALMLAHGLRMAPRRYNFERASVDIARAKPDRLVFLWDHPVDPVLHPEQLSALGGFFLHRQGLATRVDAVVLQPGEDPNARLEAEAGRDQAGAILWLYDTVVQGTAATRRPPRIGRDDASFRCRQYGAGRFGVVACLRRAEPPVS